MFVPGIRQGSPVPDRLFPFVLGFVAIGATLVAWGALAASSLTNESTSAALSPAPLSSVRSVAYLVPASSWSGASIDALYVRSIDGGSPRFVTSFALSASGLRASGSVSPTGDQLAVVSVPGSVSSEARVSLVAVADASRRDLAAAVDYLSPVIWSADGRRLLAVHTVSGQEGGSSQVDVLEFNSAGGEAAVVARFDSVFQVAPVGYSIDGERMFIVTVDQAGSVLWTVRGGHLQRSAVLSTGLTRDWSLSPDGARLAFVDKVTAGERRFAGRTLVIATGAVSNSNSAGNEYGSAWKPDVPTPLFGGPGGTLHLDPASPEGSFVVPSSWSPDGSTLVATIFSASGDRGNPFEESVELVTSSSREPVADVPGTRFIGWVRNLN